VLKENSPEAVPWPRRAAGEALFHLLGKGIEVKGRENLPSRPPYLIAFNHMGWAEALALVFCLPVKPAFMVKREAFNSRPLAMIIRQLGGFPVSRGEIDRQALKTAVRLLNNGGVLAVAPEGTRGRGEERSGLKRAKRGVIYLACKADQPVPIVPVAVWGTEGVFPLIEEPLPWPQRLYFRRAPVRVRIGPPFREHYSFADQPYIGREDSQRLACRLMEAIRDLLPREYHGVYRNFPLSP